MATGEALTFGELLRRARVAAGLTQEELAERAHLSARAISDLEGGARRAPYKDTVRLLAEALGLDAQERMRLEAAARRRGKPAVAMPPAPPAAQERLLPSTDRQSPFVGRA